MVYKRENYIPPSETAIGEVAGSTGNYQNNTNNAQLFARKRIKEIKRQKSHHYQNPDGSGGGVFCD